MIRLVRFAHLASAEVGVLLADSVEVRIWSLELPWLDNRRDISCIPAGMYKLRRWSSVRHRVALEVVGEEPKRSDVLIHPLNKPSESRGCIGLGLEVGGSFCAPQIFRSLAAVQMMFDTIGSKTVDFEISNGGLAELGIDFLA